MNFLIIEELLSDSNVFTFYLHEGFKKDIKKYQKKKYPIEKSIGYLVNLLSIHFNSKEPEKPLSNNIFPAENTSNLPIYKTIIVIAGLRKGQCPRTYILILPSIMVFLCADDHTDNYKDSQLRQTAIQRAKEVIEVLNPNGIV
ncbi:MAG: hypothetical protein NT135_01030 [Candidatus Berkelbacteria bacterium]|nr:hypothetical protein [Candidatus Berkelbacteria bacterium]